MNHTILNDELYLSVLLLVAYSLEVGAHLGPDLEYLLRELRECGTEALLHVAEGLAWQPERASAAFRNALGATYRLGAVLDILRMAGAISVPEHRRGLARLKPVVKGLKTRAMFP